MLKMPQITLFATNSGSKAEKLKNAMLDTMGKTFDQNAASVIDFITDADQIPGIVSGIRVKPGVLAMTSQGESFNAGVCVCVYIIDDSQDEAAWNSFYNKVSQTIHDFNSCKFNVIKEMFIVQKDGLDLTQMDGMLTGTNAPVCLMTQLTSKYLLSSTEEDEIEIISNFAVLMAAGEFVMNTGVYVFEMGKLSLTREDFDRVKRNFVVRKLINDPLFAIKEPGEQELTDEFISRWCNTGTAVRLNDTSTIVEELTKKITGKMPPVKMYSLLAYEGGESLQERIADFFEINKAQFVDIIDKLTVNWHDYVNDYLQANPAAVTVNTAAYLKNSLSAKFLGILKAVGSGRTAGVNLPAGISEKPADRIEDLIRYAGLVMREKLEEYAYMLMWKIAAEAAEFAEKIEDSIEARDELIRANKWLLPNSVLTNYRTYVGGTIDDIQNISSQNVLWQNFNFESNKSLKPYSDDPVVMAATWGHLISESMQCFNNVDNVESIIGALNNNTTSVNFYSTLMQQMASYGIRFAWNPNSKITVNDMTPEVVTIYPNTLNVTAQYRFVSNDVVTHKEIPLEGFDNIIQYKLYRVCEGVDVSEIIKMVDKSKRSDINNETDADSALRQRGNDPVVKAAVRQMGIEVEKTGNQVKITLPVGEIIANVAGSMRAYHKDGCDYNLIIANKAVNGRVIVLDIPGDMYGECTILLTGGKYASKPLRLTVNTNTEVIGYKRKLPFLGKTVKAQNEKYKKVKFSLAGDDSGRNIKAVFAIANSDFVYPAGEGSGEWETWIPEGSIESVTLRSNDPRRMFSLRLKQ